MEFETAMRRSTLCDLADVDESYYKSLVRRDQLPFAGDDEDGKGWGRYELIDAVTLRCTVDLTRQGGIAAGGGRKSHPGDYDHGAGKVVYNALGQLRAIVPDLNIQSIADGQEGSDFFLAIEHYRYDDGDSQHCGSTHYAGTLLAIAFASEQRAAEDRPKHAERFRLDLVNISRAARFVLSRSEKSKGGAE
jgi:hypothetical protein